MTISEEEKAPNLRIEKKCSNSIGSPINQNEHQKLLTPQEMPLVVKKSDKTELSYPNSVNSI